MLPKACTMLPEFIPEYRYFVVGSGRPNVMGKLKHGEGIKGRDLTDMTEGIEVLRAKRMVLLKSSQMSNVLRISHLTFQ
jgi:hypothetical protein